MTRPHAAIPRTSLASRRSPLSHCLALAGVGVLLWATGVSTLRSAQGGLKDIYDPKADGEQLVQQAIKQAAKDGKRVLLQFGANWCADCHAMHKLFESNQEIASVLKRHFVVVMIDVDNRSGTQRNAELVKRYGNPFEGRGIPALVVLDSTGAQLTNRDNNPLQDDDHRRPEKVLAFLKQWAAPTTPK